MAGVYKLEITQSWEELKQTLAVPKIARAKDWVQLLYLLKTGNATTIQQAAQNLGRNRVKGQTWLRQYRDGGMEKLLEIHRAPGRPRASPKWAQQALDKRLQDLQRLDSYGAITN